MSRCFHFSIAYMGLSRVCDRQLEFRDVWERGDPAGEGILLRNTAGTRAFRLFRAKLRSL